MLSLLALSLACSAQHSASERQRKADAGEQEAGGDEPIPELPTSAYFIAKLCQYATPCCASNGHGDGEAACRDKLRELEGESNYDRARARLCLERLRTFGFASDGCPNTLVADECREVFYARGGSTKSGERCDPGGPRSQCTVSSGARAACEAGNQAEVVAKTARCFERMPGVLGDACDANWSFGFLVFDLPEDERPATGHYCDELAGLVCDRATRRCAERKPLVLDNGHCMQPFGQDPSCAADEYCPTTTFECSPRAEPGDPCDAPESCRSGRCTGSCQPGFGGLPFTLICGRACRTSDPSASSSPLLCTP